MKIFIFFFILSLTYVHAQENLQSSEQNGGNVIVKYKQYESFDLGSLEIQGNIVAPGDLTVGERDRKRFGRNIYEHYDFDKETRDDILNFR